MKKKIFFRVNEHDPNNIIQLGTLAKLLQPVYNTCFLIKDNIQLSQQLLLKSAIPFIKLPQNKRLTEEAYFIGTQYLDQQSMLILQGNQFRAVYQEIIKDSGCQLTCLEKDFQARYVANLISSKEWLNQEEIN
jgi:hypothetical protein